MPSSISPALQVASAPAGGASGPGGSPRPNKTVANQLAMRVSDAERAEVADRLSWHYGEGRLDEDEFSQRLDQVMTATTYRDLSGMLQDLPLPVASPRPDRQDSRAGRASRADRAGRGGRGAGLKLAILAFLLILVVGTTHIVSWALAPVLWVCVVVAVALMVARRRAR
jgi:Domain of unknown function (DUF1707)